MKLVRKGLLPPMIYYSARTSRLSVEVRLAALQRTRNQSDAKVQELEKAHSEHTRMGLDLRRQLFSKFSEVSDHMDVVDTQLSIVQTVVDGKVTTIDS